MSSRLRLSQRLLEKKTQNWNLSFAESVMAVIMRALNYRLKLSLRIRKVIQQDCSLPTWSPDLWVLKF